MTPLNFQNSNKLQDSGLHCKNVLGLHVVFLHRIFTDGLKKEGARNYYFLFLSGKIKKIACSICQRNVTEQNPENDDINYSSW